MFFSKNIAGRNANTRRYILGAGLGHNGSKWLAMMLDRIGLGIKATHERKNEECGKSWDQLLRYEIQHGVDHTFNPYFDAIKTDLENYRVVVDTNSWQGFSIPHVDRFINVDSVIWVVRNGIQSVNSMYEINRNTNHIKWLESDFLPYYQKLLKQEEIQFKLINSFERWCYWWTLNASIPTWLSEQLGADRVQVYRFEDLIEDVNQLQNLIDMVFGEDTPVSMDKLYSLQKIDVNRKIEGDRSIGGIWHQWSTNKRESFNKICEHVMQGYGYSIPADINGKKAVSDSNRYSE